MSSAENVALVRRMLDVIVQGNTEVLSQIVTSDWVNHDPNLPPLTGLAGAAQLVKIWRTALPDAQFVVEDSLSDGDKVALRFRLNGSNTGNFMDIPATRKKVNATGTGIFLIKDGEISDNWVNFDALGVMQQLGIVPIA